MYQPGCEDHAVLALFGLAEGLRTNVLPEPKLLNHSPNPLVADRYQSLKPISR